VRDALSDQPIPARPNGEPSMGCARWPPRPVKRSAIDQSFWPMRPFLAFNVVLHQFGPDRLRVGRKSVKAPNFSTTTHVTPSLLLPCCLVGLPELYQQHLVNTSLQMGWAGSCWARAGFLQQEFSCSLQWRGSNWRASRRLLHGPCSTATTQARGGREATPSNCRQPTKMGLKDGPLATKKGPPLKNLKTPASRI
jgi:hypothetical protein